MLPMTNEHWQIKYVHWQKITLHRYDNNIYKSIFDTIYFKLSTLERGCFQNIKIVPVTRPCHFCMTFDLELESYICYVFWVPYEVYIKDFQNFIVLLQFCLLLIFLNPPSGVENLNVKNPPLSYIKSCVLTCTLKIWTSFVSLPEQNLA